jgi:hypothetical protein
MNLIAPIETHAPKVVGSQRKRDSGKNRLREFIKEALEIARKERKDFSKHFPGVPQVWPAWPYIDYGAVASTVEKDLGDSKKSANEILWRLKRFQYPYPVSNAQKPTNFYRHAKSVGVLKDILNPPLLTDIRFFWWSQRYDSVRKQLRVQKKSEYGHALAFHQELMYRLSAHLAEIENLAKKHAVKKGSKTRAWFDRFGGYRKALLKQLLGDAAIVYPRVQDELKPAGQIITKEKKIEAQVSLFEKFNSAIKRKSPRGRERHKFAYHLTSLVCTPREIILKHRLCPTPVTVRKNVEGWKKRP